MALVVRLHTMNHPFLPDSLITQELVPSLFEELRNNLKFIEISSASLLIQPYKVLPSTKKF